MNAEIVARLEKSFETGDNADVALLLARKDHEITAMELKHQLLLDRTRNFASRADHVLREAVDTLQDLAADEEAEHTPLKQMIYELDDLQYDARELSQVKVEAAQRRIADLMAAADSAAKRYDEVVTRSAQEHRDATDEAQVKQRRRVGRKIPPDILE